MRHLLSTALAVFVLITLSSRPSAGTQGGWATTTCTMEVHGELDPLFGPVLEVTLANTHAEPVLLFPVFQVLEERAPVETKGNILAISFLDRDRTPLFPQRTIKTPDAIHTLGPPHPEWFVRLEPQAVFGFHLKLRDLFDLSQLENKIAFVHLELRSDLNELNARYPGPYQKVATLPLCTRSSSPEATLLRKAADASRMLTRTDREESDQGSGNANIGDARAELRRLPLLNEDVELEVAVRNLGAGALWLPARFLVPEVNPTDCPVVDVIFSPPSFSARVKNELGSFEKPQRRPREPRGVAEMVRLPSETTLGRRFTISSSAKAVSQEDFRVTLRPRIGCVKINADGDQLQLLTFALEARLRNDG